MKKRDKIIHILAFCILCIAFIVLFRRMEMLERQIKVHQDNYIRVQQEISDLNNSVGYPGG